MFGGSTLTLRFILILTIISLCSCATKSQYYTLTELHEQEAPSIKGLGAVEVDSEYTVLRYDDDFDSDDGDSSPGKGGHGKSHTRMHRIPEWDDRRIKFEIFAEDTLVFTGITPTSVRNLNPGTSYTIIWSRFSGRKEQKTFVIPYKEIVSNWNKTLYKYNTKQSTIFIHIK